METIVETRSGRVAGRIEDGLCVFRGVPYAAPPVGARRFAAPERPLPWSGVRDAFEFGASAPQPTPLLPLPGMEVGRTDEDCLYLNVTTPGADGRRRPVLVWIHGGAFVLGSGSQPVYDGAALARRGDAVVVTLNYRLGPLGFLYLAELCPELPDTTANAGLRDQVAALEWVRDNIEGFGGDPGNVTIFGESAGGMSVATLLGHPSARGLFHRAIAQSGAAHNCHTRASATRVAEEYLGTLGLARGEAVRALRDVPAEKLAGPQGQMLFRLGQIGVLAFQPVVDGDALPAPPLGAIRDGLSHGVPLLVGTTRDEWKLFAFLDPALRDLDAASLTARLTDLIPGRDTARAHRIVDTYRATRGGDVAPAALYCAIQTDRVFRIPSIRLAEAQLAHEPRVFAYQVTWESPALGGLLGACHGIDVPFVFGRVGRDGTDAFVGSGPEAEALQDAMMDAWISFARGGDPGGCDALGEWPAYDARRRATMLLGPERGVVPTPGDDERACWDGLL